MEDDQIDVQHPNYTLVKDLGKGSFGVTKLMRYLPTKELVAVKFIPRGRKIDQNVEREIVNHRTLLHPNIVRFREVFLTTTHLATAMDYAAGGELFAHIAAAGRLPEDHARFLFQQLVAGVAYCHSQGVVHRDLKLENLLLSGSQVPLLKICDFGYSKSVLNSQPRTAVGTPGYFAPEVMTGRNYNGALVDVWSCGVVLYVMLRSINSYYKLPGGVGLSHGCLDLISQIFTAHPAHRITMAGILAHPWYCRNIPRELQNGAENNRVQVSPQSEDDVRQLVHEAQHIP